MTDLHDLAQQIAANLGSAWVYQPGEYDHYAYLERIDGLRLLLRQEDKRLVISPDILEAEDENGQRATYHYDLPRITVNPKRTAAAIAGDIRSRLLRDAESWYAVALHWRESLIRQAAKVKALRADLLAFPGARLTSIGGKVYGPDWTCEPYPTSSNLVFRSLSPEQIVRILNAYYQTNEEPMCNTTTPQPDMFPNGEDLPLFSGAPVRAKVQAFAPQASAAQMTMFDLRPTFGGAPAPTTGADFRTGRDLMFFRRDPKTGGWDSATGELREFPAGTPVTAIRTTPGNPDVVVVADATGEWRCWCNVLSLEVTQ